MTTLIFCFALARLGFHRLKHYLLYFQQEEYEIQRFLQWWWAKKAFDKKGSALCLIAYFIPWTWVAFALAELAIALEGDPCENAKKRLVLTPRARRILWVAFGLFFCLETACLFVGFPRAWLLAVVLVQAIPGILALGSFALQPVESGIQKRFSDAAIRVYREIKPYTVGITGSYGKTSTKDALGQMLRQCLGPTFWPPKGVNTRMGITRCIREELCGAHRYAVIEMGAYAKGSIQLQCQMTPPHAAIVTAVGLCHLERFGSSEAIFQAKSELAKALPKDGILVCNGDDAGASRIGECFGPKETYTYGFSSAADVQAKNLALSAKNTAFQIVWKNKCYPVVTPLLGRPAVGNLLAAFTMAALLGADPDYLVAVMATMQPVENRLRGLWSGGVLHLQDAYNSNPVGFRSALEVLEKADVQRRILMTPGMVELGFEQERENYEVAVDAAKTVDLALLVGPTNRRAWLDGLLSGGLSKDKVIVVEDRTEAFSHLAKIQRAGDGILVENDLPDLYEPKVRF